MAEQRFKPIKSLHEDVILLTTERFCEFQHICGEGHFEVHEFTRAGMLELQHIGMERLTAEAVDDFTCFIGQ
jgi:hypothetical protein